MTQNEQALKLNQALELIYQVQNEANSIQLEPAVDCIRDVLDREYPDSNIGELAPFGREKPMTQQQKEQLENFKTAANHAKSDLMRLEDRVAEISPRKAASLSRIIGKLEYWQNSR